MRDAFADRSSPTTTPPRGSLSRLALAALFATSLCGFPAQAAAQAGARVAILPYFSPDPSIARDFAYALYAVPDLLREQLMADARFEVVEKKAVDEAIIAEGFGAEGFGPEGLGIEDEAGRRGLALRCGADYYIWGYLLGSAEGIKVFHLLAEVEPERSLHIVSRVLPRGPGLIDAMGDSVLDLYRWTQADLPAKLREPVVVERTVVVEKEVIVEKPVVVETVVVRETELVRRRLGLRASPTLSYLLFPWSFKADLRPVPAAGLAIAWTPGIEADGEFSLDLGISLRLATLGNREGAAAIDVVMLPLLAEAGLEWMPARRFGLRLSAAGGLSLVFGRVDSSLMNYSRPLLAAGLDAEWRPLPGLALRGGAWLNYGFDFYSDQDIAFLEPRLSVDFRL